MGEQHSAGSRWRWDAGFCLAPEAITRDLLYALPVTAGRLHGRRPLRAAIVGDFAPFMEHFMPVWFGAPREMMAAMARSVAPGATPLVRAVGIARAVPKAARVMPRVDVACREAETELAEPGRWGTTFTLIQSWGMLEG